MDSLNSEQLAARWTQHQRQVEAFVYSLLPDFQQTDDVLQNVAIVVVRKRESYDPGQPFLPWVLQIAKYEVLKHRRTVARDRHCFQDSLIDQLASVHESAQTELAERRQAVVDCVRQAGESHREALLLRYVKDLKPQEIARQLDLTDNAARNLLHRARQAIRSCIERKLGPEESRR